MRIKICLGIKLIYREKQLHRVFLLQKCCENFQNSRPFKPKLRQYSPSLFKPSLRQYSPSLFKPKLQQYSPSLFKPKLRQYSPCYWLGKGLKLAVVNLTCPLPRSLNWRFLEITRKFNTNVEARPSKKGTKRPEVRSTFWFVLFAVFIYSA